ncbi:hypothetical protein JAO73_10410 [Hymenobacter sp. BT523]|uniref:hypothetical protein n=1 Tax=Hymenobacter sp. BT523 TaxID=2795725 RepID=UPI0018ED9081|nr:hypothetical protein [Hymenobacter sp. BT523]MBJ6109427.1 hypothetical protein [Hymenobacter sp. BT523]
MAGERLASQTVFIRQSALVDGHWIDLWLDGAYRRIVGVFGSGTAVPPNTPNQYTIVTTANAAPGDLQRLTVANFIYGVEQLLLGLGVGPRYTVAPLLGTGLAAAETVGCVIQATEYDAYLNFREPAQQNIFVGGFTGYSWPLTQTDTIRPVRVAETHANTGAFGTATGTIALVASNGTVGTYTYLWTDPGAPFTPNRSGLAAGSYTCTVTDASGANTTVVVAIGSDARLDVLVNRSDNNVALVPSGGVAPYAFLWADGPTTAARLALPVGTYTCTVTDARGATRQVVIKVDPYRFYWSKNPVTLALDAGDAYRLDPTSKPNLSFVCEVWVEEAYRSNAFVQVGATLEQPADRFGRTVFDAQALLDAYLTHHLPDVNQAVPSRADCLFRRFYFKYAEKYGPVPVAAALSSQAQHYVVLGGLDFFEAAAGTWFTSYQAGAQPFLTWEPTDKPVLPDQPEYLYFMPDSFTLASFQLQVLVAYADGTSGRLTAAVVNNAHRFEVYCLPAGYEQLGLGGDAATFAKPVASWEVWVSDAAGVAQSERRRYVLRNEYVARPRYFLYTNSLGGVSTLCCTGDAKTALDVKTTEADRPQGVGYDPRLGDTDVVDKSGVPTLSASSGKLRRAQLVALQDFLLSPRVTLQAGGVYWPGRVKAKSAPVADETGELPQLEFDFLLPKQRLFSPRLPQTAAGRAVVPVRGGEGAQP